jgi:hypothetical protein
MDKHEKNKFVIVTSLFKGNAPGNKP